MKIQKIPLWGTVQILINCCEYNSSFAVRFSCEYHHYLWWSKHSMTQPVVVDQHRPGNTGFSRNNSQEDKQAAPCSPARLERLGVSWEMVEGSSNTACLFPQHAFTPSHLRSLHTLTYTFSTLLHTTRLTDELVAGCLLVETGMEVLCEAGNTWRKVEAGCPRPSEIPTQLFMTNLEKTRRISKNQSLQLWLWLKFAKCLHDWLIDVNYLTQWQIIVPLLVD